MQHWGERNEGAYTKPSAWEWLARIVSTIVMAAYVAAAIAPVARILP